MSQAKGKNPLRVAFGCSEGQGNHDTCFIDQKRSFGNEL